MSTQISIRLTFLRDGMGHREAASGLQEAAKLAQLIVPDQARSNKRNAFKFSSAHPGLLVLWSNTRDVNSLIV